MPKMGESITEGTVITWHKQVGDHVELDETLLEIGTDKVDTEVPAVAAGIVAEILAEEGDVVPVGTVIAVIKTEESAEPVLPEPEPAPADDKVLASDITEISVVMPKMGESITRVR